MTSPPAALVVVVLVLVTFVWVPWSLGDSAPATVAVVPGGGAAGGPALYLPEGDLLNVRNIQGGIISDPNLDLGAGSATHRGDLVLNYDVGRRTLIYNGHKRLLVSIGRGGIRFYVRPHLAHAKR